MQVKLMYLYVVSPFSGAPSFPPMVPAQQLFNNPMVTEAAVHYGHQLASQGQAMVDQKVTKMM